MFLLQAALLNERSKRDASDARDASGDNDENDQSASSADCSLLVDYIENELPDTLQLLPGILFNTSSALYELVITDTAPAVLELLESTPSLFDDITEDVNEVSVRLSDVLFLNSPEFFASYQALAADFVDEATDECDVSLSREQVADVTRLFDAALPTLLIALLDCSLLNQTIIEDAVAAAAAVSPFFAFSLPSEIGQNIAISIFSSRTGNNIVNLLDSTPTDEVPEAAQTALDEFLFTVNDFCGVPTLSGVTLAQLNQYYLVDLVMTAATQ